MNASVRSTLRYIVLVLLIITGVDGRARLWLRFKRFDNPGGNAANGQCCDGTMFVCPSKCDHMFTICIDRVYGRQDTQSCPYGKKVTSEIPNQDSIIFQDFIGNDKNPMIFDFDWWPGRVKIKISVWDKDDNADDFVDFISSEVSVRPAPTMAKGRVRRLLIRNRVSLKVDVMVFCGPSSYGPACDKTCSPQNDASAGYSCDPDTGDKVCLDGWTGKLCNQGVDDCLTGRCMNGATCQDAHLGYSCICPAGYAGSYCETDINECLSYPCQNKGQCVDKVNGFECICTAYWSGRTCEINDACRKTKCYHGGTCFNVDASFVCKCRQGFAGRLCETDLDECTSSPCENGGTCNDFEGGFNCTCAPGWTGETCEVDINECASSPCVYGKCRDIVNGLDCICDAGYTGRLCETDINECASSPCQNGATCLDEVNAFTCKCAPGWTGGACQADIDECASSPCVSGTCKNLDSKFECVCNPGYSGRFCGVDTDECASSPCKNGATCKDMVDAFNCTCAPGWTGQICDVNIDECASAPCKNGANCTDMVDAFNCTCAPGWTGKSCEVNVDECEGNPCVFGTCQDLTNDFECTCNPGYTGNTCATNIDECLSQPCQNNGTCADDIAEFRCTCSEAWNGSTCDEYIDRCVREFCKNGAKCTDPGPSEELTCQCVEGWAGGFCEQDVDECLKEPCANGATCLNSAGSFSCQCTEGWTGVTCEEDIDECLLLAREEEEEEKTNDTENWIRELEAPHKESMNYTQLACHHAGLCVNVDGGFLCQCLPGWEGERCQTDVNECLDDPCQNRGLCRNAPGNFSCNCLDSWTGRYCEKDVDECARSPCEPARKCQNHVNGFTCLCPQGWTGDSCETDIDECLGEPVNASCDEETEKCNDPVEVPCRNRATCRNLPGSFQCLCSLGWTGQLCEQDVDECSVPYIIGATLIAEETTTGTKEMTATAKEMTPVAEDITTVAKETTFVAKETTPLAVETTPVVTVLTPVVKETIPVAGETTPVAKDTTPVAVRTTSEGTAHVTSTAVETDKTPAVSASTTSPSEVDEKTTSVSSNSTTVSADMLSVSKETTPGNKDSRLKRSASGTEQLCKNGATCINTPGSFHCQCAPHWSGRFCDAGIDICASKPCKNGGVCTSVIRGEFNCSCVHPWKGATCSEEKPSCSYEKCYNNATCISRKLKDGGGVQCVCPRGWRGPHCQDDRNECDLHPCLNHGTCTNLIGGFVCTCQNGITGKTCSNNTALDEGLQLPLYLDGSLQAVQKEEIQKGIGNFLQKYGDFRPDTTVKAYVKTHDAWSKDDSKELTRVSVRLNVDNTWLSKEAVTEIFNRVPPHSLRSYLPEALYFGEVEEEEIRASRRLGILNIPWYYILGGSLALVLLIAALVILHNRNSRTWCPRGLKLNASRKAAKEGARNPAYNADIDDNANPPLQEEGENSQDGGHQAPVISAQAGHGHPDAWGGARPRDRPTPSGSRPSSRSPTSSLSRLESGTYAEPCTSTSRTRPFSEAVRGRRVLPEEPRQGQRPRPLSVTPDAGREQGRREKHGFGNALYLGVQHAPISHQPRLSHSYLPPDPYRGALPPPPALLEPGAGSGTSDA